MPEKLAKRLKPHIQILNEEETGKILTHADRRFPAVIIRPSVMPGFSDQEIAQKIEAVKEFLKIAGPLGLKVTSRHIESRNAEHEGIKIPVFLVQPSGTTGSLSAYNRFYAELIKSAKERRSG
jgi:hypothetical protein